MARTALEARVRSLSSEEMSLRHQPVSRFNITMSNSYWHLAPFKIWRRKSISLIHEHSFSMDKWKVGKRKLGFTRFPHLLVTLTALQAAGWWQGGDYYYYEPIAAWIILWLWPRWQWRLEPENRLELKVMRFTSDFNFILSLLLFPPPRRHSSSSLWIKDKLQ